MEEESFHQVDRGSYFRNVHLSNVTTSASESGCCRKLMLPNGGRYIYYGEAGQEYKSGSCCCGGR